MKNRQGLQLAKQLIGVQLMVVTLSTVFAWCFGGGFHAKSSLLGGLVSIIPNVCFAGLVFQSHGAQAMRLIARQFYRGEAIKITLSAVMFWVVFRFFAVAPLTFFIVYMVAQAVLWVAPWVPLVKIGRSRDTNVIKYGLH